MSVTDGGVFSALQSAWHTHISLSSSVSLSLSDLLLRLDDQEWEAWSRKENSKLSCTALFDVSCRKL